jgi:anthranilate synthase component 2
VRTLVVDAYDSFVYIIVQYLREADMGPVVRRNDETTPAEVERLAPDMILLGPGPGHPKDAGYVEIIERFKGRIPIMGVCLGHQAIGLAFGGEVVRARRLMHGKESLITHDGEGCFRGAPQALKAIRYHSLVIDREQTGPELAVTATSSIDGYVMGVRHPAFPVEGVQFHPESVGTEFGIRFFENFRTCYVHH